MGRSAGRIHATSINIICGTIAVTFCLTALTAMAGVNELTPLGPEGGEIIDVEFHRTQPGVVYMAAPPGVFRSADGGSSWQLIRGNFLDSDLVYDIAVDPTDSQRVYLAAGEGLFVSQDGGATFSRALLPNRQGLLIRVKCGADGVVYAPDGANMYRSQDRGQSWQQVGSYPQAHDFTHALAVHPTDSRIVYASLFGSGIFVSQDSGATWALASPNAAIQQTMDVEIDRTNPLRLWAGTVSGVYKSDNAGADWTQARDDFALRIEIDPLDSQLVYATGSFSGTLMRTTDGGANWSALPQHFGNSSIPGVVIHPTQPERMIAYSDGIWLSSDAGALWTRGNTGLVATGIQRIVQARGTSRRYLATTRGGIHRLDDNNIPRAVDNARLGALSTPSNVEIVDLVVTPTATLDALVTIFAVNQLARSFDGGAQWERIALPVPTSRPFSLALSQGPPVELYVGTGEGVFSSVDLGDHWAPRNTGVPNGIFMQRLLSTSDPAVLYAIGEDPATGSTRLFRTTDRAQSWAATALPAGLISGVAVHPSDPQTVYVGHDQRLSRTTDGGATWVDADVDTDHYNDVAVDPSDTRVVYASATTRVIRSTDGGTTWERLEVTQNFYASSTAIAVDPVAQNAVLVGSIGLGLRQLSIRPDVQLTIAAPASMAANAIGTFTLQVQNRGPYHARDVRVVMQLPTTATNISATNGAGSCSVNGQQVTCTIESLKANTTATIALNAAGSGGPFSVQASATANEADLDAANNSASAQVTVGAAPAPPSNSGGGGGGGGGAMQLLMLLALSGLAGLRSIKTHAQSPVC
jgi:photosystem II stability/assembly factor-like uncharacterized protein